MRVSFKSKHFLPGANPPSGQKGTVIITVLMLVAVATYLAVELTHRQRIDITRTGTLLALDQSEEYVKSAEALAQYVLEEDLKADIKANKFKDDLDEDWSTRIVKPIGRGIIDGQMFDLQGRFNLNRLLEEDPTAKAPIIDELIRLLTALNIPSNSDTNLTSRGVAERIADWIDPGTEDVNTDGMESQGYLLFDPPYNAGNRILVDLSELMLVSGLTSEDLELLAPHVALLPPSMPMNINTATAEALEAVECLNGIAIIGVQERGGVDPNDFSTELGAGGPLTDITACPKGVPDLTLFSASSSFFLLDAKSEVDKRSIHMHSILYRSGTTAPDVKARVILRKQLDPFSGV